MSGQQSAPRSNPAQTQPTGRISGRVFADEPGADLPLTNVRVSVTPSTTPPVFTDRFGRFTIDGLSVGTYSVTAQKAGYARTPFGGADASAGAPIHLDGGAVDDIEIRMPRGASISGRITDDFAEPAIGAMVSVFAIDHVGEALRLGPLIKPAVDVDDLGAYRVGGLPAGEYVVMARESGGGTIYYPGVPVLSGATPIRLGEGQDRLQADIRLQSMPRAMLTITIAGMPPGQVTSGTVGLVSAGGVSDAAGQRQFRFQSRGDDSLQLTQMLDPADWIVVAQAGGRRGIAHVALAPGAAVPLAVQLGSGARVRGRVVFEDGQADSAGIRIQARGFGPDEALPSSYILPSQIAVDASGAFDTSGLLGTATLVPSGIPIGWAVKAFAAGDHDLLDEAATFDEGTFLDNVEIRLTRQVGDIAGTAIDAQGRPAAGCYVTLMPARDGVDPASSRIQLLRADQKGRFAVDHLVAGAYLLTATRALDTSTFRTAATLEALRAQAMRLDLLAKSTITLPCANQ